MTDMPNIGPVTVIPEDTAMRMEELLNALSEIVGYSKVPVDGHISAEDGERIAKVQLFLFSQMSDPLEAKANKKKFEKNLKELSLISPPMPGSQLFAILHQDRILTVLEEVYDKLKSGELTPKKRIPVAGVFAFVAIGLGFVWAQGSKR